MVATLRWLLTALLVCACAAHRPWGRAHEAPPPRNARRVDIEITGEGFRPNRVEGRVGETITLVFTRTVERSCVDHVILSLDEDRRVERDLPLRAPVAVTLVLDAVGELGFSCPMGMHGGALEVR